jgi:hypothetical protein
MKTSDIVSQLQTLIPQFTAVFTDDIGVSSMIRSGTTITVECSEPHFLKAGQGVSITGAAIPVEIVAFSRDGAVGTITTATDHDITYASHLIRPYVQAVVTSGAVEPEFNGSFNLVKVLNRRNIQVTMTDSGPIVATGTLRLAGATSVLDSFNKTWLVDTVPSPTTFTFIHGNAELLDPTGTIIVRKKPRISGSADPARMLQAYTQQPQDKAWMFVVLGTVVASKNRSIEADGVDNWVQGTEYRQQIIQGVEFYVFLPTKDEIAGREKRDDCEDIFIALNKAVLMSTVLTGYHDEASRSLQFNSHATFQFDAGTTYIHLYQYEASVDLLFEDTVGPAVDVPLETIDFTITPEPDRTFG